MWPVGTVRRTLLSDGGTDNMGQAGKAGVWVVPSMYDAE